MSQASKPSKPRATKPKAAAKNHTPKTSATSRSTPLVSVGKLLQQRRVELGMSLGDIELATRIRGKYLRALEADDYQTLPHPSYSQGFVKAYAKFIGLDAAQLTDRFAENAPSAPAHIARRNSRVNLGQNLSLRSLTLGLVVLILGAVGGYLFWQYSSLTAPPHLEVTNPSHDQVLYGSLITVDGHVTGGADVFVNDSPILSDANGNFSDSIALQEGVNAVRITARNHLGKSTTVTRNILAHVPKTDLSNTLPAASFDGIAVRVEIKDVTASVVVRADGKEVFRGTMLPGTVQTFKATTKILLTTNNGGATALTVTNQTTAAKSLGPVGALGQPKADLEFSKDTQFQ